MSCTPYVKSNLVILFRNIFSGLTKSDRQGRIDAYAAMVSNQALFLTMSSYHLSFIILCIMIAEGA